MKIISYEQLIQQALSGSDFELRGTRGLYTAPPRAGEDGIVATMGRISLHAHGRIVRGGVMMQAAMLRILRRGTGWTARLPAPPEGMSPSAMARRILEQMLGARPGPRPDPRNPVVGGIISLEIQNSGGAPGIDAGLFRECLGAMLRLRALPGAVSIAAMQSLVHETGDNLRALLMNPGPLPAFPEGHPVVEICIEHCVNRHCEANFTLDRRSLREGLAAFLARLPAVLPEGGLPSRASPDSGILRIPTVLPEGGLPVLLEESAQRLERDSLAALRLSFLHGLSLDNPALGLLVRQVAEAFCPEDGPVTEMVIVCCLEAALEQVYPEADEEGGTLGVWLEDHARRAVEVLSSPGLAAGPDGTMDMDHFAVQGAVQYVVRETGQYDQVFTPEFLREHLLTSFRGVQASECSTGNLVSLMISAAENIWENVCIYPGDAFQVMRNLDFLTDARGFLDPLCPAMIYHMNTLMEEMIERYPDMRLYRNLVVSCMNSFLKATSVESLQLPLGVYMNLLAEKIVDCCDHRMRGGAFRRISRQVIIYDVLLDMMTEEFMEHNLPLPAESVQRLIFLILGQQTLTDVRLLREIVESQMEEMIRAEEPEAAKEE